MFSFTVVFFCFAAIINTIQGQNQNQAPSNLSLILINSTNSGCLINQTQGGSSGSSGSSINLCLNDGYQYRCRNNNNNNNNGGNGNNVSLVCILTNNNSECHNSFISNENNNNITLDCVYRSFNSTLIGNQFNLQSNDECMYGIYFGSGNNTNETLLVCAIWVTPIIVTTFNNTKIFEQNSQYYKFPLFGFEVNKHFVKSYGIAILVAIIVVSCLVALCCYGLCRLCMRSMKGSKRRSSNSNNNNNNYDMNRRMPQSNTYNI